MSDIQLQETDYKWFLENYHQLYEEYGVSYLTIKSQKVLGKYSSYAEALHETEKTEPVGSFIIQYCNGNETGYTNYVSSMFVMGHDSVKCQIDHPPVRAFVSDRESTCRELKTKATLVCGNEKIEVIAQWDTGASGSCISQRVIQVLKPARIGLRTVLTPTGSSIRGMYYFDK